jgi:hypothetical protein
LAPLLVAVDFFSPLDLVTVFFDALVSPSDVDAPAPSPFFGNNIYRERELGDERSFQASTYLLDIG